MWIVSMLNIWAMVCVLDINIILFALFPLYSPFKTDNAITFNCVFISLFPYIIYKKTSI
jgi:hypothetical protein